MEINDIITSSLSFVAIIISIVAIVKTNGLTRKIAIKTLNSKFFEELYFEYIITKLPKALLDIKEGSPRKLGIYCENAQNIVIEILIKSQFYRYFENDFYEILKSTLVNIEEILTKMQEPNISNNDIFDYRRKLTTEVNQLYNDMRNYYTKI